MDFVGQALLQSGALTLEALPWGQETTRLRSCCDEMLKFPDDSPRDVSNHVKTMYKQVFGVDSGTAFLVKGTIDTRPGRSRIFCVRIVLHYYPPACRRDTRSRAPYTRPLL